MTVVTSTDEIISLRKSRLKKIFATHPHACVQCAQKAGCVQEPCSTNVVKEERCCPISQICELRKLAEYVGIPANTARYLPSGIAVIDTEPLILRDYNLCIGCLRCVRICRDVRKIDALGFIINDKGDVVVGARSPNIERFRLQLLPELRRGLPDRHASPEIRGPAHRKRPRHSMRQRLPRGNRMSPAIFARFAEANSRAPRLSFEKPRRCRACSAKLLPSLRRNHAFAMNYPHLSQFAR